MSSVSDVTDSVNNDYYELYSGFSREHWGESAFEKVQNVGLAILHSLGNLFLRLANLAIAIKNCFAKDVCLSCWFKESFHSVRSFFCGNG